MRYNHGLGHRRSLVLAQANGHLTRIISVVGAAKAAELLIDKHPGAHKLLVQSSTLSGAA